MITFLESVKDSSVASMPPTITTCLELYSLPYSGHVIITGERSSRIGKLSVKIAEVQDQNALHVFFLFVFSLQI